MSITVMKQALEALENTYALRDDVIAAKESLRQAIAEAQKQKPVAWVNWCAATGKRSISFECESELASQPLYFGTTQTTQDHYSKRDLVAFEIYKPTPPRGAIPNVRDAELPWVYDQDPSSGNVASMWVTPVKPTPQPKREPLTDEQIAEFFGVKAVDESFVDFVRAIEAAHGIKGEA